MEHLCEESGLTAETRIQDGKESPCPLLTNALIFSTWIALLSLAVVGVRSENAWTLATDFFQSG
eukprot:6317788-Amphidinium_carterae.1